MLNREECEQACLYLLSHCYETDAPALENGDKDKTYTFTPSGFKESEIFKRLIEEHFTMYEPSILKLIMLNLKLKIIKLLRLDDWNDNKFNTFYHNWLSYILLLDDI